MCLTGHIFKTEMDKKWNCLFCFNFEFGNLDFVKEFRGGIQYNLKQEEAYTRNNTWIYFQDYTEFY